MISSLFGNSILARVLDFLIVHQFWDYTKTEISRNAGISRKSLHDVWPTLKKFNLIKETKRTGKAKPYRFNRESEICQLLTKLYIKIALQEGREIIERRKLRIPEEVEVTPEILEMIDEAFKEEIKVAIKIISSLQLESILCFASLILYSGSPSASRTPSFVRCILWSLLLKSIFS